MVITQMEAGYVTGTGRAKAESAGGNGGEGDKPQQREIFKPVFEMFKSSRITTWEYLLFRWEERT